MAIGQTFDFVETPIGVHYLEGSADEPQIQIGGLTDSGHIVTLTLSLDAASGLRTHLDRLLERAAYV